MSAVGDALRAAKEALLLADKVERMGGALDKLATEVLEHDRRITRLEAQWDTALQLGGRSAPKRVTRKRENDKE